MARQLRIEFDGAWYHVMNRGINHQKLFFNDQQRDAFFDILDKTRQVYGIEIHAYCLMDNHYHLILHTPRGNISHAMKYLNSSYARYVNVSMKRDGPLFKGRYKAIVISADEYLINLSRYIHLNPLEAKNVQSLQNYPWSSYRSYIGVEQVPGWLCTVELVKRYGEIGFHDNYRNFVEFKSKNEIEDGYSYGQHQPVLGGDDFRKMIDEYVKRHSLSAEVVGADRILVPPSMSSIIEAVALFFNVDSGIVCKVSNYTGSMPRRIAAYVCRELGGYHLNEIANEMGGVTYKAISSAIRRVRLDAKQLSMAEVIIEQLKSRLKTIRQEKGAHGCGSL